ncbi:histidine-specific methyltransferase [Nemania sp. FL0916]|nr:histidine-specific methyltransferase [Nemania sp. FL0916]
MSPTKLGIESQPQIFDIRHGHNGFDLKREIVEGLQCQPRSLPSLLLWDDRGQDAFDRVSQTPSYYPFHSEMEVLREFGTRIGGSMPADGILLELGCGAVHKTKLILSGFRKQNKAVQYFALDVCHRALAMSLLELREEFADCPLITITGLLGTYDDSLIWLSSLKGHQACQSATILWLGNSICNMSTQEEASIFLERFSAACRHADLACRFVVSTDICQNEDKIMDAYDLDKPEMQSFIFNALDSANAALGYEALSAADWVPTSWLDNYEHTLHFYLTAKRDVHVPLRFSMGIGTVTIRKGERMHVIPTGKWSEDVMSSVCERAGFQIQQRWKDISGDYCVFLLSQERAW